MGLLDRAQKLKNTPPVVEQPSIEKSVLPERIVAPAEPSDAEQKKNPSLV